MIDSSGAVGDLVAVDGPIFFASELHKFHRDLANLADLDLERFFGGDVLVPAESASGLLTGDLVGRLRDHCVVRDHMIDLGDLVHGVAFDEQLILAERDQAAGFKAVETCASRRASTPTFRAARTIPFYTFGGTFAGSAGLSRSSGVITRTGPDLPTARKPIDHAVYLGECGRPAASGDTP